MGIDGAQASANPFNDARLWEGDAGALTRCSHRCAGGRRQRGGTEHRDAEQRDSLRQLLPLPCRHRPRQGPNQAEQDQDPQRCGLRRRVTFTTHHETWR